MEPSDTASMLCYVVVVNVVTFRFVNSCMHSTRAAYCAFSRTISTEWLRKSIPALQMRALSIHDHVDNRAHLTSRHICATLDA